MGHLVLAEWRPCCGSKYCGSGATGPRPPPTPHPPDHQRHRAPRNGGTAATARMNGAGSTAAAWASGRRPASWLLPRSACSAQAASCPSRARLGCKTRNADWRAGGRPLWLWASWLGSLLQLQAASMPAPDAGRRGGYRSASVGPQTCGRGGARLEAQLSKEQRAECMAFPCFLSIPWKPCLLPGGR